MRGLIFPVLSLGLGLVLAGCGTPEYQAERAVCQAEWNQKIPPDIRQQLVTRYRTEQRPTGQTTCTTVGNLTECNQVMTTVSIPYTAVENVDVNAPRRDVQVRACVARACTQKFGNEACKPPA